MIRVTKRLAALALMAAPLAFVATQGASADERLVHHAFAEDEVVRINGRTGVQATIAFGKNEAIENVAVGDSTAWQITPNKRADLLFVKPLEGSARTNMTVVTNRHTYFFDLVASTKLKPLYMLRFTYKEEPEDTAPAIAAPGTALADLSPAERAVAEGDPLAMPAEPADLNFAWTRTGSAKLMPSRVYDDGVSTYLTWPDLTPVPAILIENEKGDEGPVNYAVRGATIVISDVPDKLILRAGKATAELVNTMPLDKRAATAMAAQGTASAPGVPSAQGN